MLEKLKKVENLDYDNVNSILKNFETKLIKSVLINGKLTYNNNHFIENYDYNKLEKLCVEIIKKTI